MGLVGLSDAGEPGGRPMLAAKERRFATAEECFQGYHSAIPLTVAYSAIFVTIGQEQRGNHMKILTANDAKWGFVQLIRSARTEPVVVAKDGWLPSS